MQQPQETSGVCGRPSNLRPADFKTYVPRFQEPGYEEELLEFPDENDDSVNHLAAGFSALNQFTNDLDELPFEVEDDIASEYDEDSETDEDNGVTFHVEEAEEDEQEEEENEEEEEEKVQVYTKQLNKGLLSTGAASNLNLISPMPSPDKLAVQGDSWVNTQSEKKESKPRRFSRTTSESGSQMLMINEIQIAADIVEESESSDLDDIEWKDSPKYFKTHGFGNVGFMEPDEHTDDALFDQDQLLPVDEGRQCPAPSFDFEATKPDVWSVDDAHDTVALQEPNEYISNFYETSDRATGRSCPSPEFDLLNNVDEDEHLNNVEEIAVVALQEPDQFVLGSGGGGIEDTDALFEVDEEEAIHRGRNCPSPSFDNDDEDVFEQLTNNDGRQCPPPMFDLEEIVRAQPKQQPTALANITNKITITSADSPLNTNAKMGQNENDNNSPNNFNTTHHKDTPKTVTDLRKATFANLLGKTKPKDSVERRVTPLPDNFTSINDELTPGVTKNQTGKQDGIPRRILAFSTPRASPSIM